MKILLIQLKRAGDVIVTTPVAATLRQALPDAKIDFLVDKPFAPILEHNPSIDRIQIYDRKAPWITWRNLRAASYDWILDFQSSPRSILAGLASGARVRAGYRVSFWGRFFKPSVKRPGGNLSVTDGKMTLARALLPALGAAPERRVYLTPAEREWAALQMDPVLGNKRIVGLIPTHRRSSRRWPAAHFVQLARLLISQGHGVWLFWGPGERDYVEAIQRQVPECRLIPDTSLRQMAALLNQCKIVITNDNGPMHLAVSVGTPTVTFYGPTDPTAWNPGGSLHLVVQAQDLSCLGCNLNACPFGHECMAWVTPEQVFARSLHLLSSVLAPVSS